MSTASVNEVRLIGNLGGDPVFNRTESGTAFATLSIATSYRRGEIERTEWHRIVLWQGAAERAHKYLRKGASVYIEGRLQTRRFADTDGSDRWVTEVVAHSFQMLGSRRAGTDDDQRTDQPAKAPVPGPTDDDLVDDQIPF